VHHGEIPIDSVASRWQQTLVLIYGCGAVRKICRGKVFARGHVLVEILLAASEARTASQHCICKLIGNRKNIITGRYICFPHQSKGFKKLIRTVWHVFVCDSKVIK